MDDKLGRSWLLLRGLSREAEHWGGYLPVMQKVFPDANIYTLDLPGTGQLYRQESPDSISSIMEIVRQQALERGFLQQPLTILALSMGGMVAWEWLLRYPADLNGAVLVNTSFASLSPFYRRLRWQSYGKLARILLQTEMSLRELEILQLVCNLRDKDEYIVSEWIDIQASRPVRKENGWRQIVAAASYKPTGDKPRQPVLLVNSRGDRLVAPICSVAIRDKWHLKLCTHPWAGHDLSLDDSAWLADCLKNWVDPLTSHAI